VVGYDASGEVVVASAVVAGTYSSYFPWQLVLIFGGTIAGVIAVVVIIVKVRDRQKYRIKGFKL
jgi:hypothetical protein